jgi:hypothetical protein
MIFRTTQKLNKKLKLTPTNGLPLEMNPFGDWSADLFTVKRTHYIIISNTPSLYSVVIYGQGITHGGRFVDQAIQMIRSCMEWDGKAFLYQRFVMPTMNQIRFSNTLNRSTTGSLNELVRVAKRILEDDSVAPSEVGTLLNDILLSFIAGEDDTGYCTPNEAFKRLVDSMSV